MKPYRPLILVVDDEALVTQMLAMVIELGLEAEVVTTNSSGQALDIIRERKVTLLLTDYLMPEMNGLCLIRAMRDQGIMIPVILLTGYCDEPELDAHAGLLAPFKVVVKPWNNEQLLGHIQFGLEAEAKKSRA